jgi:serine/threonine protein kinase
MWAIGVITYFLLCGYTPFEGGNTIEEMNAIINAEYHFHNEYWKDISDKGTPLNYAAFMLIHINDS